MYVHTEYIIRMIKNVKMVEYDKCAAVRVEKNKNTLKGDQSVSRNSSRVKMMITIVICILLRYALLSRYHQIERERVHTRQIAQDKYELNC